MSIAEDEFFNDLCIICLCAHSQFTLSSDDEHKKFFKRTLDCMIKYIDLYVEKRVNQAIEENK